MIRVREHRTARINRARLRLELTRAVRPSAVVLIGGLVGLLCAGYIALNISRTLLAGTYEVRFAVADATGVVPGLNEVRYRGIRAGTIVKVETAGGMPVLVAEIQEKYGRIHRDARAVLRPNTALQDMYLDIVERGTPAAGVAAPAQPLPETRTETPVHIDDVLNVFRAGERDRLRTLLDNLGNGTRDRGAALRTAFAQLVPFLEVAGRTASQLERRASITRRLVHNSAVLTTALSRRDDALKELVTQGALTLRTLQDSAPELDTTLRRLPGTLTVLDTSLGAVHGVLGDLDAALRALSPIAGRLPASLTAVRRLNRAAAPAVAALQEPVHRLVPFAQAVAPLSTHLRDAVVTLRPQADTIDHVTKDLVACEKGVQGFFQWNASMTKFGDIRGPVPRGNVVFGLQSSGVAAAPDEYAPQACTPGRAIGGRVPQPSDKH